MVAPDGLNATVTPLGSPLALIVTAPVKLVRVMATWSSRVRAARHRQRARRRRDGVVLRHRLVVVPFTAALAADTLPVPSTARTVYEYVVLAARPVSVNVRPVGLPTGVVLVPRNTW